MCARSCSSNGRPHRLPEPKRLLRRELTPTRTCQKTAEVPELVRDQVAKGLRVRQAEEAMLGGSIET